MKVFISNTGSVADVGAIVLNHKVRLGNKYAFLFNKEVIGKAKSNLFSKPPKRAIGGDFDAKLEEEVSTSSSSGETMDRIVREGQVNTVIAAAAEEQTSTTKRLVEDLLNYEEFLCASGLASFDSIREVRKFTRFLIANALKRSEEFSTISRESISMAALVLAAEKFELDQAQILNYISDNFHSKRISKLAKVRECRAYSLLTPIADTYDAMPSSP